MKRVYLFVGMVLVARLAQSQVTHFVDANSLTPVAPYTNWATAAMNIPEAISVAETGDTVLVAAGVYAIGSRVTVSNCTLESVAGAAGTVISNDVYMGIYAFGSNALVKGFSITGLRTNPVGIILAGGAVMDSCWVHDNVAVGDGSIAVGGVMVEGAVIENCRIYDNQAVEVGTQVTDWLIGGVMLTGAIMTNSQVYGCQAVGTQETNTKAVVGGVCTYIDASVVDCAVRDNTAYGRSEWTAGGLFFNYEVLVQNTDVAGNSGTSFYDGDEGALLAGGVLGIPELTNASVVLRGMSIMSNAVYCGEDLQGAVVGGLYVSQDEPEELSTVADCCIGYNSANPNTMASITIMGGMYGSYVACSNVLVQGNMSSGILAQAIGGVYLAESSGTDVRVKSNWSYGGRGAIGGTFFQGGTYDQLVVSENEAESLAQAVAGVFCGSATLRNVLVADNHATARSTAIGGGSLTLSTVENGTIVHNHAEKSAPDGEMVGGVVLDEGVFRNSIAYHNLGGYMTNAAGRTTDAGDYTNVYEHMAGGTVFHNNCFPSIRAVTNGANNITSNPGFISVATANYQLQPASPCQDAGNNSYAPTNASPYDLAGAPRIIFGVVDMGVYEQQVTANTGTPGWWLESYGLTNYEADASADSDGDGTPTWKEYIADTVPTNAASVLMVRTVLLSSGTPPRIEWTGGTGVVQYLEYTTNLSDTNAWGRVFTNLPPTAISNHYDVSGGSLGFYRVNTER